MLALNEKTMLIQAIGQVVLDEVTSAMAPLRKRLDSVESALAKLPEPTVCKGLDAELVGDLVRKEIAGQREVGLIADHDDLFATLLQRMGGSLQETEAAIHEWTREYVSGVVATLPKPEKGEKGEPGEPGKPGVDGTNGKDGRDGVNGADGKSVSLDELRRD